MENIQKISMDIMDNRIYEPIYTKQYDIGRKLQITITENDNLIDLTDITPIFQMKKPDNTVIIKNATKSDNIITVELDKNITACYGNRVPFQIQLFNSTTNTAITTITGYMFIDESVVKLDDIESTSDFSTFTDILIQINDSSEKSKLYAENAKLSEGNASQSENNALNYANEAKTAKENAETSSVNAAKSESNAAISEKNALQSEKNAKISEDNTLSSEQNAKLSEGNAKTSEINAKTSETNSATSEENALQSANQSRQYAIGVSDSSKYYYEQAKTISESFAGALRPMGTVTFANLPSIELASPGDMYNISDEFITTDEFKEGRGFIEPSGSNIYKTSDGKWDVLAGTPVTGIKGNNETNYRRGNVNIACEDIGALSLSGDSANNIVSFTSNDDISGSSWTEVSTMKSSETHSSVFNKISTMFKNIRFLYKTIGTTDISTIGDGTISNAISTLNSNLSNYLPLSGGTITGNINGNLGGIFSPDGNVYLKTDGFDGWISTTLNYLKNKIGKSVGWSNATLIGATGVCVTCVVNNIAYINMEITPTQVTHGTNLISNFPRPAIQIYTTLPGIGGSNYPVVIDTEGRVWTYFPTSTVLERIDYFFSYPIAN